MLVAPIACYVRFISSEDSPDLKEPLALLAWAACYRIEIGPQNKDASILAIDGGCWFRTPQPHNLVAVRALGAVGRPSSSTVLQNIEVSIWVAGRQGQQM